MEAEWFVSRAKKAVSTHSLIRLVRAGIHSLLIGLTNGYTASYRFWLPRRAEFCRYCCRNKLQILFAFQVREIE